MDISRYYCDVSHFALSYQILFLSNDYGKTLSSIIAALRLRQSALAFFH